MYPQDYEPEGNVMGKDYKNSLVPFSLSIIILLFDQITKALIVAKWPRPGTFIKDVFGNDLVILYHVRNKAIAFSLGDTIPQQLRVPLFIIVPLLVLALLIWYYFSTSDFTRLQRWAIAGIIGGGLGNIIDRIFRKDGVVDFVSVKFYGIFGMERWPTFNVADSSVVVCCCILLVTMIINREKAAE